MKHRYNSIYLCDMRGEHKGVICHVSAGILRYLTRVGSAPPLRFLRSLA